MRKLCTTVTFSVLLICHALEAQSGAPASATDARTGIYDPSLDARVEALLRKMTLEEKVGQLVQYSAGQPTGPGTGRTDYEDMIAKGQIGALFNISTAKETNAYQRIAVEKSRLKIPIVFGLDVIHGFRTVFPVPLAHGIDLGSAAGGAGGQGGGARSLGNRDSLDVFSHGRHRPRCPLGPHHGRRRRRPVSRFRDGGRLRSRLSGNAPGCTGQHRRLRQALRRIRSGRGRSRLQHHRNLRAHAAPDLSPAFSRRRQRRSGHHHVRLQLDQRRAGIRQSVHPAAGPARGMGISRRRRQRLGIGARADPARHRQRSRDGGPQGLSWRASTWTWPAASITITWRSW